MLFFHPRTLRVRLATMSLIAVVSVASVYVALWYLRAKPAWRASLAERQNETAREVAEEIQSFVQDRIQLLISANGLIQFPALQPGSQKQALYRILKMDPVIQEISVANDAGREVLRLSRLRVYRDNDLRVIAREPKFHQAVAGNVYIGPVYHGATKEPFLSVALPIRFAGEVRGVMIAELAIKALWDAVAKIKVGRSGLLFVVDPGGVLIAHPDYSKVLLGLNLSDDPRVRQLFRGEKGLLQSAIPQKGFYGKEVLSHHALVPTLGWGVVVEEPVESAFADIMRVEKLSIAILVVTMLGAVGLSFFLSERIARPIRQLERGATLVAQGNLDHQLDIHTGDELESLASRFSEMKVALKASYLSLKEKIAERESVTELLEKTVRELERQKFALDQHAIVSITDTAGTILYANDKFAEITGYSKEELVGQNHRLIKSGLHPLSYYQAMWLTIANGKVWRGEFANRRKDGSIYWVNSTIVPLLDKAGLPYQYVGIRTDITAQKEVAASLAQARQREIEIGHQIQQSLLFGSPPQNFPGVEIAAYTQPSQGIDGDFFEFFVFNDQCFDVMIGDVMGKGVTAALIGAAVKNHYNNIVFELSTQAKIPGQPPDPAMIINRLNRRLSPELLRLEAFVTLAYYRIDLGQNHIEYVDAGHPPAAFISARSRRCEFLRSGDLPIGVDERENYSKYTRPLAPGDFLFLYSDGVNEARDIQRNEFGLERLSELVQELVNEGVPPAMLNQCMRRAIVEHENSEDRSDDFTTIALRFQTRESELSAREFTRSFKELRELRQWLREMAAASLSEAQLQSLTLAAVEVATNIIRHADRPIAAPPFLCHIEPGRDLTTLAFYYLGESFVPGDARIPELDGEQEGGFGLFIIEHSVDEVIYSKLVEGVNLITLKVKPSFRLTAEDSATSI